jgi:hypothetical protein
MFYFECVVRLLLHFTLIAFFLHAPACASEGDFHAIPANYHFVWPKELFQLDPSKFVEVKIDLPYGYDGSPRPNDRSVYYVDLNEDGTKEIIVSMGQNGQQEDMGIFQFKGGKWTDIGTFENGCSFCSKWNGYYQIEDGGNGGGGITSRRLLRFIRGRYREVRDEIYERGVLNQIRINPNGLDDED